MGFLAGLHFKSAGWVQLPARWTPPSQDSPPSGRGISQELFPISTFLQPAAGPPPMELTSTRCWYYCLILMLPLKRNNFCLTTAKQAQTAFVHFIHFATNQVQPWLFKRITGPISVCALQNCKSYLTEPTWNRVRKIWAEICSMPAHTQTAPQPRRMAPMTGTLRLSPATAHGRGSPYIAHT